MDKTVTDSITIKVLTRDNPKKLATGLDTIKIDLKESNLSASIVLIDDSTNLVNRNQNKKLFQKVFCEYSSELFYMSQKEYSDALNKYTSGEKEKILSLIGMMGSIEYKPSRAKNLSQFIKTKSKHILLLDDDILINPDRKSDCSVTAFTLAKAGKTNSFVSVNLKGFPDLSFTQLLERSIVIEKDKLHPWNEDISEYSLSGGFLLYPRDNDSLFFPNLYNEDYLWVAFSARKRNMQTLKLPMNVFHNPANKKEFSLKGLSFQGIGEISFVTLSESVIDNLILNQKLPQRTDIQPIIDEYVAYLEYLIILLRENDQISPINSPYFGIMDLKKCRKILKNHLDDVNKITYRSIQNVYQNWMKQQNKWITIEPTFTDAVTEIAELK